MGIDKSGQDHMAAGIELFIDRVAWSLPSLQQLGNAPLTQDHPAGRVSHDCKGVLDP
jgi:hypothetical protein